MSKLYQQIDVSPRKLTLGQALGNFFVRWTGGRPGDVEKLQMEVHNLQQVVHALLAHMPADQQRAVMYQLGYEEVDDGN